MIGYGRAPVPRLGIVRGWADAAAPRSPGRELSFCLQHEAREVLLLCFKLVCAPRQQSKEVNELASWVAGR